MAETPGVASAEEKPGVFLDDAVPGWLVSLEMLDASHRVALPNRIDDQVGSPSAEGWPLLSHQSAGQRRGASHGMNLTSMPLSSIPAGYPQRLASA
jgi:hypothetical protein